jgi:ferric-dicitrate binding protein FerR (iron transport regulator)
MTQDNRIWVLLSRRLSGEATAAELEELMHLLEQSPQKQYLFNILHSWFADRPAITSGPSAEEDADLEKKLRRILDQPAPVEASPEDIQPGPIEEPETPVRFPSKRRTFYAAAIAASVLLCSVMGWNIFHPRRAQNVVLTQLTRNEEVLAKAGTRTKLLLPDGTQVWLNSNSRLKYSNEFNTVAREVGLEGEAYFDVVKDAKHPFIVHTSSLDIKVLGTSFTIKSYPQDETIETTLLRGMIEVSRKDNPNTARVILKPNEKLVFNKRSIPTARIQLNQDTITTRSIPPLPDIAVNSIRNDVPDSDKIETAWMYNRLVFKGDNFKELTAKMERWYNVKITIRDTSLSNCHFGGAFASETVEEAFKALQLTTPFTYKINGNEIELYAKR